MSRIKELYKLSEYISKEIEIIRNLCPHTNYTEGNYMWAPGHMMLGMVCNDCDKYLGEYKTFSEWTEDYTTSFLSCEYGDNWITKDLKNRNYIKNNMDIINSFGDEKISREKYEEKVKDYL